jgi:hypothetical protein
MNDDSNFPPLPNLRPLPYPDRSACDPANHQHDTVYSLNFGSRILARTIGEDQWNSGMDNIYPEGTRILVGQDDRGNHLIRYILINIETEDTPRSFRRVTYLYRPDERGPIYHLDATRRQDEPIGSIPNAARVVIPRVNTSIVVDNGAPTSLAPTAASSTNHSWNNAIAPM